MTLISSSCPRPFFLPSFIFLNSNGLQISPHHFSARLGFFSPVFSVPWRRWRRNGRAIPRESLALSPQFHYDVSLGSLSFFLTADLSKHKRYEIRLSVYNAVGEGPISAPQEVFVGEAGTCLLTQC